MPTLDIRGLSVRYAVKGGTLHALEAVNLTLHDGDFVVFLWSVMTLVRLVGIVSLFILRVGEYLSVVSFRMVPVSLLIDRL